jgi:hypothetical protein
MAKNSGIELIAAERKRHVEQEGYSTFHDDEHTEGELSQAAAYYCYEDPFIESPAEAKESYDGLWPYRWDERFAKRAGFPRPTLLDLVKSGALIAAELDRRIRAGELSEEVQHA